MVFYNSNREFESIEETLLHRLGFKSQSDFFNYTDDFAKLFKKKRGFIHNFKFISWIDYILNNKKSTKTVIIQSPNGEIKTELNISEKNGTFIVELKNIEEELKQASAEEIYFELLNQENSEIEKNDKEFDLDSFLIEENNKKPDLESIIKKDVYSSDDLESLIKELDMDNETKKMKTSNKNITDSHKEPLLSDEVNFCKINSEIDNEIKNELNELLSELEESSVKNILKKEIFSDFNLEKYLNKNNINLSQFKDFVIQSLEEIENNKELIDSLIENNDTETILTIIEFVKNSSKKFHLNEIDTILDQAIEITLSNFKADKFYSKIEYLEKALNILKTHIENLEERIKPIEENKNDILCELQNQFEEFENREKKLQKIELNSNILKQINYFGIPEDVFEDILKDFIVRFMEMQNEIDEAIQLEEKEPLINYISEIKDMTDNLGIEKISKIISQMEDEINIDYYSQETSVKQIHFDEIEVAFLELNNYLNSLIN